MNVLRKPAVCAKVGGISPEGLMSWVRKGGFPKPFYLSYKTPVWDEEDVDEWLTQKKNQPGGNDGNGN